MKIGVQSKLVVLFSFLVIIFVGGGTYSQVTQTDKLARLIQENQDDLHVLNSFQSVVNNQVLYGVDLIRTKDISGDRIVSYRMSETRLTREIKGLQLLLNKNEDLDLKIEELIGKGNHLSKICKEDLLAPLYTHTELDEALIERLIYSELNGLALSINDVRNYFNNMIQENMNQQTIKKRNFLYIFLPLSGLSLLLMLLFSYIIIRNSLVSINEIRFFFSELSSGQCRLDVVIPVKGKNEITLLRKNFNNFMKNLSERHSALKEIAQEQVYSGEELRKISLNNSASVTQLKDGIKSVHQNTLTMTERVDSSVKEVQSISHTLDSIEKMSSSQKESVSRMANDGNRVVESFVLQKSAVEQQMTLMNQVQGESLKNKEIMELLRDQTTAILEQSSGIASAIDAIQDLANQTDILAINASIESAHAGVYGKGFAVVANEMRNLSDRVKKNANYVSGLLTELVEKIMTISKGEQDNRNSILRLIEQNNNALISMEKLKSSQEDSEIVVKELLNILLVIKTESSKVHHVVYEVTNSGVQISRNMDELKEQQKDLFLQSEEMNQGILQISDNVETIDHLSELNTKSALMLNSEIRKLGE